MSRSLPARPEVRAAPAARTATVPMAAAARTAVDACFHVGGDGTVSAMLKDTKASSKSSSMVYWRVTSFVVSILAGVSGGMAAVSDGGASVEAAAASTVTRLPLSTI